MTRLPTGDNRQVPSGVKRRFPLQYTVPSRLENYLHLSVVEIGVSVATHTL